MAFEVRLVDRGPIHGGGNPVACRFTDDEWWNFLSLAHECGFDPDEEYVPLVYPAEVDETHELDDKVASGLYIGVNMLLNQDTLPFATTWESDDDRLHFRWAAYPTYARDRKPEGSRNAGASPTFSLYKRGLRRLLKSLSETRTLVARVEDSETY